MKYYYPALSDKDLGWIRIGGPGLANCMFLAANAYISSIRGDGKLITPTWCKFSLGPILRKEHDKRVYNQLFNQLSYGQFALILFSDLIQNRGDHFARTTPLCPEIDEG